MSFQASFYVGVCQCSLSVMCQFFSFSFWVWVCIAWVQGQWGGASIPNHQGDRSVNQACFLASHLGPAEHLLHGHIWSPPPRHFSLFPPIDSVENEPWMAFPPPKKSGLRDSGAAQRNGMGRTRQGVLWENWRPFFFSVEHSGSREHVLLLGLFSFFA